MPKTQPMIFKKKVFVTGANGTLKGFIQVELNKLDRENCKHLITAYAINAGGGTTEIGSSDAAGTNEELTEKTRDKETELRAYLLIKLRTINPESSSEQILKHLGFTQ